MKRILGIVIVLLLVMPCAFAEGTTEKKNAFEFCDMYMQHLLEMKYEDGLDLTDHFNWYWTLPPNPLTKSGQYCVNIPAGMLIVSVPEFSVIRLDTELTSGGQSDEELEKSLLRATVAYASLEYNQSEVYSYPSLHQLDPEKPESVMHEASDDFLGAVTSVFSNQELINSLCSKNGNVIPLISGDYEYSLQYFSGNEEDPDSYYINLIAESKE